MCTELSSFKFTENSVDLQPITLYPKFLSRNPSFLKSEETEALGSTGDHGQEPCDPLMCVYRNPNHKKMNEVFHYIIVM